MDPFPEPWERVTTFLKHCTLAFVVVGLLGCRGAVTPRPSIAAHLEGNPGAQGTVYASLASEKQVEIYGTLGSGYEWGATVRSGTCADPGATLYTIGPVENGHVSAIIDALLEELAGKIVVLTPLGSEEVASCGVLGGS